MTLQELRRMEEAFRSHCHRHGLNRRGPGFSVDLVDGAAKDLLADVLKDAPCALGRAAMKGKPRGARGAAVSVPWGASSALCPPLPSLPCFPVPGP